jgi:hypothetical protein
MLSVIAPELAASGSKERKPVAKRFGREVQMVEGVGEI